MSASDKPTPSDPTIATRPASTALVRALTDSQALPALIEKMAPAALQSLVSTVGIEDSGALIVHASAQQIAHLIDESIWAADQPGAEESLSVPELLRWFEVWLDISASFAADKLFELGDDFAALSLAKLIVVGAVDSADAEIEQIGGCLVSARYEDEWDTIREILLALWSDYPDFAEAVMRRLEFSHSILRITGEDDFATTIESDASYEREQRKEGEGFVGTVTASAFLLQISHENLEELIGTVTYDAHTAMYFQRRSRLPPTQGTSSAPTTETTNTTDQTLEVELEAELVALERELNNYERGTMGPVALLAAPTADTHHPPPPLRTTLAELIKDVASFTRHSDELVYLSNLVKAEITVGGQALTAADAADLVMATCNLAGGYLLWLEGEEARETDPAAYQAPLEEAAGLVRLFRIGWKLLSHLPVQAAMRLSALLTDESTKARWQAKPWLAEEVDLILHQPGLIDMVKAGELGAAREAVAILSIALQPDAITLLTTLLDDVPRLPDFLLADSSDAEPLSNDAPRAHYVTTTRDLFLLDRSLSRLQDHLK